MIGEEYTSRPILVTWRDFVDAELVMQNRRDLADYLRLHQRLPSDEDQLAIRQHIQKLAEDAVVIHFDNPQQAAGVLLSGRFRSAMEQGRMLPELVMNRGRAEAALFGERCPNIDDIIYGTLGNTGSHGYGDVAIYLKNQVKTRSTVTRKDSLNAMTASDFDPVNGICVANGFDDLDCLTVPLRSREEIIAANRIEDLSKDSYFEVQIHGGVTIDDIESISAPKSAITGELEAWAGKRGIIIEERKQ